MLAFDQDRAPRGVCLSMAALSARFVSESGTETTADLWHRQAKRIAFEEVEDGTMSSWTLAALICCFHYELWSCTFGKAWMTAGNAIRLAWALGINHPPDSRRSGRLSSPTSLETRKRLMWATRMIDLYLSDGLPEYSNIADVQVDVALPSDEQSFRERSVYDAGTLSPFDVADIEHTPLPARTLASPLAQYIRVFRLRTDVLSYARSPIDLKVPPWLPDSRAQKFSLEIDAWKASLPPSLCVLPGERTAPLPQSDGELSMLLSIHLWYCMARCDLGRLTIFNFAEAAPAEIIFNAPNTWANEMQDQCVNYAAQVFEAFDHVLLRRPTFACRDPYVAACCYQAVRISLWDLYRHPSPSLSVRRFTAKTFRPVLEVLYVMSRKFTYVSSVMNDIFALLQRYRVADVVQGQVSQALGDRIGAYRPVVDALPPSRASPGLADGTPVNAVLPPATPIVVNATIEPDLNQTELFRPPFWSRKDPKLTPSSDAYTSPSASVDSYGANNSWMGQNLASSSGMASLPIFVSRPADQSAGEQTVQNLPNDLSTMSFPFSTTTPALSGENEGAAFELWSSLSGLSDPWHMLNLDLAGTGGYSTQ